MLGTGYYWTQLGVISFVSSAFFRSTALRHPFLFVECFVLDILRSHIPLYMYQNEGGLWETWIGRRERTCLSSGGGILFLVVVGAYAACCQLFYFSSLLFASVDLSLWRTFLTLLPSSFLSVSVYFLIIALLCLAALCSLYLRVVVFHSLCLYYGIACTKRKDIQDTRWGKRN